jgi:hypothetical protein
MSYAFLLLKSFVACAKGVEYVGLTMICFGVTNALGKDRVVAKLFNLTIQLKSKIETKQYMFD